MRNYDTEPFSINFIFDGLPTENVNNCKEELEAEVSVVDENASEFSNPFRKTEHSFEPKKFQYFDSFEPIQIFEDNMIVNIFQTDHSAHPNKAHDFIVEIMQSRRD